MSTTPAPIPFTFDGDTHIYREAATGRQIISVTQVLASVGFVTYGFVKESVLEYKSTLGVAVHAATHYLDEDVLDWESVAPEAINYILAYEKFKNETNFTPSMIEHRGVVKLAGTLVGYQIDRVGKCGDFPVIIDLKCTVAESESVKFQLALYEACLKEEGIKPEGQPFFKRFGLQLRPDGTYRVWGPYENPRDRQIAMCAVAVASEKLLLGIEG